MAAIRTVDLSADGVVILRKMTAKLQCKYTEEQMKAMHEERLDIVDERAKQAAWWDEQKIENKSQVSRLEDRDDDLVRKCRSEHYHDDVVTVVTPHPTISGVILIVRADTGEVIKQRVAHDSETQAQVPGVEIPDTGDGEEIPAKPAPELDAEFEEVDAVVEEGRSAHTEYLEGGPSDCPYDAGSDEHARWMSGWNMAGSQSEYSLGYDAGLAGEKLSDAVTESFANGYTKGITERADADAAIPVEPERPNRFHGDGLTESTLNASQILDGLREMSPGIRPDYFENLDRDTVISLWEKLFSLNVGKGVRSTILLKQIIEKLSQE